MSGLQFYDFKRQSGMAPSLGTQVASELGRSIVSGDHEVDSLLADEAALAERFKVSRSVIRDAVKILVGKGMLEARRGIGTRVRSREHWGMLDDDVMAWHLSVAPRAEYMEQLVEFRRVFEPTASRWAAARASDNALADIESALRDMEAAQGSVEDFIVADARFHASILKAAGNDFMQSLEGVIYSAFLFSIRLTNREPSNNEASMPFHRAIWRAIAKGDERAAERAMQRHLDDTSERLERALDNPD